MHLHIIFLIFILSLIYYLLYKFTDDLPDYFSDKVIFFLEYTSAFLKKIILQLFILLFVESLLTDMTGFSILKLCRNFPMRCFFFICCYLLWLYHKEYIFARNRKEYHFISNIRTKALYPTQRLNYLLIKVKTDLEINQKNLSLLKSFSPIPIALFIFNNLDITLLKNFNIKAFSSSEIINIILITLIGIYIYKIFTTSWRISHIMCIISQITEELYYIDNPDLYKDKN